MFGLFDLVASYQERTVQCKTRVRKEERGRAEVFQEIFKTIGQWSQERICLLINRQAFDWASHLKHRIFKDDCMIWKSRRGGDNTDSEHKVKDQLVAQGS